MTNTLTHRLEMLCDQLRTACGDDRHEALDHLAQVLQQLGFEGSAIPAWAREALASGVDSEVEDGFDNMPV